MAQDLQMLHNAHVLIHGNHVHNPVLAMPSLILRCSSSVTCRAHLQRVRRVIKAGEYAVLGPLECMTVTTKGSSREVGRLA